MRIMRAHHSINCDNFTENDTAMTINTEVIVELLQTLYLIKFFVLIRGARTPAPNIDAPVTKIPLQK